MNLSVASSRVAQTGYQFWTPVNAVISSSTRKDAEILQYMK